MNVVKSSIELSANSSFEHFLNLNLANEVSETLTLILRRRGSAYAVTQGQNFKGWQGY